MIKILNEIADSIHETVRSKGFWDHEYVGDIANPSIIPEKLALITSEVSEALEAFRDKNYDEFNEELIDILIRTLDLAAAYNIDVDTILATKMAKNQKRPFMHGRAR